MSVIGSNILAGASGQGGGYNLTNSLRLRRSASAYLNRLPTVAGNRQIFTISMWVKRGILGATRQCLFSAGLTGVGSSGSIVFDSTSSDQLIIQGNGGGSYLLNTTQVFRDPSAWYHLVIAFDTPQATASNRIKLYVNGTQVTTFGTATYPAQNYNADYNNTTAQNIASRTDDGTPPISTFDGYITEFNLVDGQALTPSSFGETNTKTGVWQPKLYVGTYGTNGFYLPFTDNSALTTSSNVGLGKDFSGNGNFWTTNNISITAGSTYDSMTDVPTLTSATASNFAVMNPLDQAGGLVFSEANLKVTAATGWDGARATFSLPSTGKYYWETTCISRSTGASVGILSTSAVITGDLGAAATAYVYNSGDGQKYNNGSASAYGATWTSNDNIGISWDADAGALVFYKNGTSQGTAYTGLSGTFSPAIGVNGSDSMNANFGQQPFTYTPPTGFVALNTFNLPTPTIGATASTQAGKNFNILLWTGDDTNPRSFTGLGFQPDFVWAKRRNPSGSNWLMDSVRGTQRMLASNSTDAEDVSSPNGSIQSFNADGFTFQGSSTNDNFNNTGDTLVGWSWKGGGTAVSNTAGSITSTVSANTSAGFSIVTYTAPSSGAFTVGHGLGVAPAMIITKSRSNSGYLWGTYHQSLGNTKRIDLNSTAAATTSLNGAWNNTSPTSTVFSVGLDWSGSGITYVAYCFSEVAGYSKFGSYTGNGSTDGVFVYTGFKPKFILGKTSSNINNWWIMDTARGTINVIGNYLSPDTSSAESSFDSMDILSNGFKLRSSNAFVNGSGNTYIYYAVAENPFKYSNAR